MIRGLYATRRFRIALAALGLVGLGWGSFEAVIRSKWLGETVRVTLLRRIEATTGGSASIDSLRLGDSRLSFEIEGLEVGNPGAGSSPPFLTVPQASVRLGWRTFVGGRTYLDTLHVREPLVQVTVGEDGSSNIPVPESFADASSLTVREFELTGGAINWNGEPFDMEFSGTGLEILTSADPSTGQYSINARLADPRWGATEIGSLHGSSISLSAVAASDGIEIRSAELRGDDVSFDLTGRLGDFRSPRFEGSYSAMAQLGWLDGLAGLDMPGLEGTVRIRGEVNWDAGSGRLDYNGTAAASNVAVSGLDLQGSVTAGVSGDLDGLALTGISGTLLDGEVSGTLEVRQLREVPSIAAAGSVNGVSLGSVSSVAGAGSIAWDGFLDIRFDASGSPWEDAVADLEVVVRPSGGPSKLPVQGSSSLQYRRRDGNIAVSSLQLDTPNAKLRISGLIDGDQQAELQVEASMESRQAVERILATVQPQALLPVSMPDGRFSFRGDLRGRLGKESEAILDGQFSVEDFVFGGERWERLALQGTLSPEAIEVFDGQLVDGEGRLAMRGTLPLQDGPDLELTASGERINAGKLVKASGFGLPIDGAVAIEAELSGSLEEPEASSRIEVAFPSFFGERFDHLEAEILYGSGKFDLQSALLRRGDSTLRLIGSVDQRAQEVVLEMASNPWHLDEFDWGRILMPGLTGTVQFDLNASGVLGGSRMLRELALEGNWEVAELQRDDQALGHWTGTIRSSRDRQNIDLDWSANVFGGVIRGEADVWQIEPATYGGNVEFREIDTSEAAEFLDLPMGAIDGSVTGSAGFAGVIGVADTFELDGTVTSAELSISGPREGNYRMSNVFPMRWGIREGSLRLDSMTMGGPGTNFEIDGAIALGGSREVDIELDGTLSLVLLQGLFPGIESDGTSRVGLRVLGTLGQPSLEGSVELVDSALASEGIPFRLNDINGTVRFENGQGTIERLSAASGGGTIRFDGAMAYRDAGFEYRVQAAVRDMRVDYPANVSSVIDGQFTLTGAGLRSFLNGEVTISRTSLREGLSFSDLFSSMNQPEGAPSAASMFQDMQVQIHVGAVSHLPVETDLIRDVEANLDLNIVGSVASPSMLGTIGIAQGEIRMLGTHYSITRGDIRFVNPLQAEPVLNVELETRIRDTDLALVLSGPAQSLDLSYRSDPPLPFHDLVNLIVVGKEPTVDPSIATQTRLQQQSLVQTGADALLSQAISRPVSRRLQRFFGVSRLKVDPQIGGLEANPSARISTEQQLADDLTLIYSYDLSSAQQQSIRIEWNPDRRWSFIVTRDQNGLVGSDILYKVRLP